MSDSGDREERIANTLQEIYEEHLDAMRRAGVADRKREGYKIESVESLRLFKDATGYLLRLRELQDDLRKEHSWDRFNAERIIGHVDDYNRILNDLRGNDSFKNAVSSYNPLSYSSSQTKYTIDIEGRKANLPKRHRGFGQIEDTVPMEGSDVESIVLPRLIRLSKDMESSLIGRCASGKRPD